MYMDMAAHWTGLRTATLLSRSIAGPIRRSKIVGDASPLRVARHVDDKEGNVVRVFPKTIPYQCQRGHSTDGQASGATSFASSFKAACEADGEFSGIKAYLPVAGPAEGVDFGPNAFYDGNSAGIMVYPEKLTVKCNPGYSLNKDEHSENSTRRH